MADLRFPAPESFMSSIFGRHFLSFPFLSVAAAVALSASVVLPAGTADLVGGYRPPAAKGNRHYVWTRNVNEECGLLKVTQSEQSRIVRICAPILNLKPNPTRGTFSGDSGGGSSYTVTQ